MADRKAAFFQGVEVLSEKECRSIARLKTKTTYLSIENVTMTTLSDTPSGFLGDHYKVVVTIRSCNLRDDGPERTDLRFFVKTKPRNTLHTEFGEKLGAFQREYDFFSTVVVLLRKYSSDAEDSDEDLGSWAPDCFLTNAQLIVLDDLSHQGFRMEDGRPGFDFDHCVVTFQTLAKFHASSIIYEENEGQRLGKTLRLNDMFPAMLKELIWTKEADSPSRQSCGAGANAAVALVEVISRASQSPVRYEKVLAMLRRLYEEGCSLIETKTSYRNVICHGDLWANNILFRYDAAGIPQEARVIDYQLIGYHPPGYDFMCTLYWTTRRETREKHFPALARAYHSTLTRELCKNELQVEEILPWSEFEASLEHFRMLGLLACFYCFPIALLSDEAAKNVGADPESLMKFMLEDQSEVALRSFETDIRYRERICEIVEELADLLENRHLPS